MFFAFWLSHVPLERFESFWSLIDRCFEPEGRVFLVDDAHRTPEELIEGPESSSSAPGCTMEPPFDPSRSPAPRPNCRSGWPGSAGGLPSTRPPDPSSGHPEHA